MSADQADNQEFPEEVSVSPALVREAASELTEISKIFFQLGHEISTHEKNLAALRSKRATMLRENPWLGNVQGIINKEANKLAKMASLPPEEEEVSSDHMAIDPTERKDLPKVAAIPRRSKPLFIATPERNRDQILKSLQKKMNKADQMKAASSKQFSADHPSKS